MNTGKPPPGSRNQWFIYQLVNGSILGCWLQVADQLVPYWLPGYLIPGYWISFLPFTRRLPRDPQAIL